METMIASGLYLLAFLKPFDRRSDLSLKQLIQFLIDFTIDSDSNDSLKEIAKNARHIYIKITFYLSKNQIIIFIIKSFSMPPKKSSSKEKPISNEKQAKLFSKEVVEEPAKLAKSRSKQFGGEKVENH